MAADEKRDNPEGSLAQHLKQFRSVLAVCRAGSTAQAAALLPLSQSAIARAIRQLESELGFAVFERGARGMLPTSEGRILAHRAGRAIAQLELAEIEAVRLSDPSALRTREHTGRFAGACAYRHLASYIAFCETRSEPAAATRLGVSQPAISQALRQLEYMLGTKLFERLMRGTRLTASGESALRRIKLALNELRLAEEDLDEARGRMRGRIVVGALPLSSGVLVPRAVDRMLARHQQGLHVTIVDGTYDALLNQLLHADVDVIVGALRPAPVSPDIIQQSLFVDTLSVVARYGHPLLQRPLHGLRDLADASWIAPLAGTPARDAFERAFAADGVPAPAGLLEANSAVVVQALLRDSDRLALLSRRQVLREISAGLLDVIPVEVKETTREIGLAIRKDADPGVGLRLFMEEIRLLVEDDHISDTHS